MRWIFFIGAFLILLSCKDADIAAPVFQAGLMELPKGFPEVPEPEDNAFTQARWELGKKLFFDPVMSRDQSISCASCHRPEFAFSDQLPFSPGIENRPGTRNAPSLANVAYQPYLLREGGVPTLEMQVLVPVQEHNEFDFNILLVAERLNADPIYVSMSLDAYSKIPDAFVITRALACFERSLLSGFSRYDQYINYNKVEELTDSEISGMNLFFSDRTNCSSCHQGFNFTNYTFENNGLYPEYQDPGRFRLTGLEEDRALFKVPGLRNIELTAPYMHDGSLSTLETVVDHYIAGGVDHPNKSEIIKPLDLSIPERNDLIAFLKSLTDETFAGNPLFNNR